MGVSTHSTIQDSTQANGQRRLRYQYDFTEGGISLYGPITVESLFDDATHRASLVTEIEESIKLKEKFAAEERAINGDDFSDIAGSLVYNTTAEAAGFILKRMSNRFQEITKQSVYEELPELFLLRKIWTELTDNQIANFMGESSVDVATWRVTFETMRSGVANYTSPFGIYADVPEV